MATKIILDCDPGHDDAIAMLLAWGDPRVELLAITTVAGNQRLELVTRNAGSVAAVGGITGVPLAAGAARPLVREPGFAASIHGESGLDGPRLPEPTLLPDARRAAELIVELVMAHEPGEVTLVPTGPLTNIALAARLEPRIVPRVREVVFMGGAVRGGNWSATSEFNVLVDPEAAQIVVGEAWPVTMIGLDATHQALATHEVRAALSAVGTASAGFVGELLDFYGGAYTREQGFAAPPVHDPCAVAYVIEPGLFETVRAPLSVELRGELTLGMTVADLRGPAPAGCLTRVALGVDADRFWVLVTRALARLP